MKKSLLEKLAPHSVVILACVLLSIILILGYDGICKNQSIDEWQQKWASLAREHLLTQTKYMQLMTEYIQLTKGKGKVMAPTIGEELFDPKYKEHGVTSREIDEMDDDHWLSHQDEVKRCPFCSDKDAGLWADGMDFYEHYMRCDCGARGPNCQSRKEALDAWNERG